MDLSNYLITNKDSLEYASSNIESTVDNTLYGSPCTNTNYYTTNTINGTSTYQSNYWSSFRDNTTDTAFSIILETLQEEELENMLDSIIERCPDDLKVLITEIIERRHFSEDFLMKYLDYTTLESVMKKHSAEVKSHTYKRIALIKEAQK